MEFVTLFATLGFYVFVVIVLIKGAMAIWNLQEREERIIEQNERQLELLQEIVKALDRPEADPKNRD